MPATPTGRNFQTTRPHARRPEPSLPTCHGTIATAILGVWVAHLMFDLPVLQVDKTSVRVGSIVRGICRDLRSIVDCLGMCRSHTRRYTYAVGLYITAVYWFMASTSFANPAVTIARSFSDTFAGIAPTGVSGFIIAQIAGMLLAVGVGRWLWRT